MHRFVASAMFLVMSVLGESAIRPAECDACKAKTRQVKVRSVQKTKLGKKAKKLTNSAADKSPSHTEVRIRFRSLLTGAESHGKWLDENERWMLEDWVRDLTRKYPGEVGYWIEERRVSGPPQEKRPKPPAPKIGGELY